MLTASEYKEKYGYTIITQGEAKSLGLRHFFTGAVCKNGHTDIRRMNGKPSGTCLECDRLKGIELRKKNPWGSYSEERKERVRERDRINSKTQKYRERKIPYNRLWASRNKSKVTEIRARRKKHIKRATPKWLTPFNKIQMQVIYKCRDLLTEKTGKDYHVDHIIPLRGENVCGLHIPSNLRVITAEENLKKRNNFDGYFEYSPNIQVNTLKREN